MKIKSFLARPYAAIVSNRLRKEMALATDHQQAIFQDLVKAGAKTYFGTEHRLQQVRTYEEYKQAVRLRDYEAFRPYIDKIKEGAQNVVWKGRPAYFAKTSGTTSGAKYIPITKDSIPAHIDAARNALLHYMTQSGNAAFANGRMIFLSGSPELERTGGIPTGRLSGIVNHYVPGYLRGNQLPSYETNCIEDWEEKLARIVDETIDENMTLVSGIPPWVQMYFDWVLERRPGKKIKDIFPNLQLIVHGGVNFEPYRARLMDTLGGPVDTLETFPASEGFFAFQDVPGEEGLLLNTNAGMFFEFVPASRIFEPDPPRLTLSEVETGVNYALIVTSNAGLWSYNIGDTVKFVSLKPYRIVVTGRIKHFISAFGEHVIGEEVEHALRQAMDAHPAQVLEFTVAPVINPPDGALPYHEWLISFERPPADLPAFAAALDRGLRGKNIYYDDLVSGGILQPLRIVPMQKDAFIQYMKSVGKLGGQNKVPRLSNDRNLAEALLRWKL